MGPVFRLPASTFVTWPGVHALAWGAVGAVLGGSFTSLPRWAAFGAAVGLAQAAIGWMTTSAAVNGDAIETRNLMWARRIRLERITEVGRVQRRSWQAVRLTLDDGSTVVLPVPMSSSMAPNPRYESELLELCASVVDAGSSDRDP